MANKHELLRQKLETQAQQFKQETGVLNKSWEQLLGPAYLGTLHIPKHVQVEEENSLGYILYASTLYHDGLQKTVYAKKDAHIIFKRMLHRYTRALIPVTALLPGEEPYDDQLRSKLRRLDVTEGIKNGNTLSLPYNPQEEQHVLDKVNQMAIAIPHVKSIIFAPDPIPRSVQLYKYVALDKTYFDLNRTKIHEYQHKDKRVPMSNLEDRVLNYLLEANGRTVKSEYLQKLCGQKNGKALIVTISRLRSKLNILGLPKTVLKTDDEGYSLKKDLAVGLKKLS